eukprot:6466686-Amphidinium_carterae.1
MARIPQVDESHVEPVLQVLRCGQVDAALIHVYEETRFGIACCAQLHFKSLLASADVLDAASLPDTVRWQNIVCIRWSTRHVSHFTWLQHLSVA